MHGRARRSAPGRYGIRGARSRETFLAMDVHDVPSEAMAVYDFPSEAMAVHDVPSEAMALRDVPWPSEVSVAVAVLVPSVIEPPADISSRTTFTKTSFSYRWSINHFSTIGQVSGTTIKSPAFTSGCDDIKWQLYFGVHKTNKQSGYSFASSKSSKFYVSASLLCLGREPGIDEGVPTYEDGTEPDSDEGASVSTSDLPLCLDQEPCIDQAVTTDNPYLPLAQPVIVDYTLSALKNGSRLITRECSPVMMTKDTAARVEKFLEQDDTSYLDDKGSLTVSCKINVVHHCEPIHNTARSPKSKIKVTKFMKKVFYHERHYADVILVAEKHEFKVHKHMLSACSDVFKSMFDQPMQESASNRVEIADVKANTLQAMVKFIYTGEMTNCELVADLTAVADKYNIQPLKAACVRELSQSLDVRNAVSTLVLAELYCIEGLREECVAFVANNMGTVKRATPEDWQELKTEHAQLMFEVFDVHADIC